MVLYHAFAGELDRRGEDHEFLFVFDGGFAPPPELVALSHERTRRSGCSSFARTFGETAALRLGIERSRGDVIVTLAGLLPGAGRRDRPAARRAAGRRRPGRGQPLPARGQLAQPAPVARLPLDAPERDRPPVPRHRLRGAGHAPLDGRGAAALRRPAPVHPRARRCAKATGWTRWRCRSTRATRGPGSTARGSTSGGCSTSRRSSSSPSSPRSRSASSGWWARCSSGWARVTGLVLLVERFGGQAIANRPLLLLAVLLVALGVQLMGLGLVGEIIVHLRSPHRRAYRVRERV